MEKKLSKVFFVLCFISFCSSALPPQIKVCPKNSPNLAECFKSSMESMKPYLKTGMIAPDFIVESLDPQLIGDIIVNRGFDMKLFAVKAYGLLNFKVEKIRINLEKLKFEMVLAIPKVSTKSTYSLKWALGLLNIQGAGDSSANLDNVKILLKLYGSKYNKNGVVYMKIDEVKLEIKPGKVTVRFENLFNGNKGLEEIGNEVINQNIDQISSDVLPQIQKGLEKRIMISCNEIFERASFDEFFP